ncbi:MAG: tRNA preQ1(34) S-adenosylmethionine ribosyltransferase-isomerase QueA [Lysobacterales bacterium]
MWLLVRKSEFQYELPRELIAQTPLAERAGSRLLIVPQDTVCIDSCIRALPDALCAGDLLVFNDTRVLPARIQGHKDSGGAVELLLERLEDEHTLLAQVRTSKPLRVGRSIELSDGSKLEVLGREGEFVRMRYAGEEGASALVERTGAIPLPPYIDRAPDEADRERYQTLFAREWGAVAAPTAGLHFDAALIAALAERDIDTATLTLHVGAGTFQPLRVDDIGEHRMHAERCVVDARLVERIKATRSRGGRIVAVGTTVVRALESAAASGTLQPFVGETRIFITPGYRFRAVDRLLTNFHLPESTLLMLVCAFGGHARVLDAYAHAVALRYRFFSYGDAMLIHPADGALAA